MDNGGRITKCPPAVARNYLTDESLLAVITGESLMDSQRTTAERAAMTSEVRVQYRDRQVTDAEWN